MASVGELAGRLYRGEADYNFLARRRTWYVFSAILLLISIAALAVRGLNLDVAFRGGAEFFVSGGTCTPVSARAAVESSGIAVGQVTSQSVGSADVRVVTGQLTPEQTEQLRQRLATTCGVAPDAVSPRFVGPTWGQTISMKALLALTVFLVLVVIFLSFYFEWKLALAALAALIHDVVITVGIYALIGFEVSPATVIGLLTVLAYSLYDTVVVFDKVKENTAGIRSGSRWTYSEATNRAVNQTLVRSINTSVIALLPVVAVFFVGAYLLGAGTLKDISLVLLIGLAAGAYSSIFIAPPLAAQLKEKEAPMQALARRVAQRRAAGKPVPMTAAGSTAPGLEPGGEAFAGESAGKAAARKPPPRGGRNQPRKPGRKGR